MSHMAQYPQDKLSSKDNYAYSVWELSDSLLGRLRLLNPGPSDVHAIFGHALHEHGTRMDLDLVYATVWIPDGEKHIYGEVNKDTRVIWVWFKRGLSGEPCGILGSLKPFPSNPDQECKSSRPCVLNTHKANYGCI